MNIISVLNQPMGGCEYYRQYMPNQLLGKAEGWKVTHTNVMHPEYFTGQFEYLNERLRTADVFQFIRRDPRQHIPLAQGLGLPIVMDIDDYWFLDKNHQSYAEYKNGVTDHTIWCLERADMVTTTTEYLAEKIRKHNSNVVVLPNGFTTQEPQYELKRREDDGIVNIGWIGGSHHLEDIMQVQACFDKLWNDKDLVGRFRFVLGGWLPESSGHKFMEYIFSARFHKNTEGRFLRLPACDVRGFMNMYDFCDLMIAPLKDTEFNRCKSNLKIVEAGAKCKLIICSDVEPYRHDGVPVVHDRDKKKKWYELIRHYILNRDELKKDSAALHERVMSQYQLEQNINHKRREAYCSLIHR